jgi:hypothetical protein
VAPVVCFRQSLSECEHAIHGLLLHIRLRPPRQTRIPEPTRYPKTCRLMPECCRAVPALTVVVFSTATATARTLSTVSPARGPGGSSGPRCASVKPAAPPFGTAIAIAPTAALTTRRGATTTGASWRRSPSASSASAAAGASCSRTVPSATAAKSVRTLPSQSAGASARVTVGLWS